MLFVALSVSLTRFLFFTRAFLFEYLASKVFNVFFLVRGRITRGGASVVPVGGGEEVCRLESLCWVLGFGVYSLQGSFFVGLLMGFSLGSLGRCSFPVFFFSLIRASLLSLVSFSGSMLLSLGLMLLSLDSV